MVRVIEELLSSMAEETTSLVYLNDDAVKKLNEELNELDRDGANPFWLGFDSDPCEMKICIATDVLNRCVKVISAETEKFY